MNILKNIQIINYTDIDILTNVNVAIMIAPNLKENTKQNV